MRFPTRVEPAEPMRGLEVPPQVVEALGGGKRPPVIITINGHSWRSRVAIMRGRHLLGLSNANRQAAGVTTGDEIEVDLELDAQPRVIVEPADFARALDSDPAARATYDHLAQSHKRRHVHAIESAKKPETRARRIDQALATLREQDASRRTSERSTMSTVANKGKQQSGKSATKKEGFTAEEKAAMKARAKELKAAEDGESAVRAALAAMPPADRVIGERLHALIKESAPELTPKTWYGCRPMPRAARSSASSATRASSKSATPCSASTTQPTSTKATMWPVAYALKELTAGDETKIRALVTKAVR